MVKRKTYYIVIVALVILVILYWRQGIGSHISSEYPVAVDVAKVGDYPALTKSGAGYMYDDVLEYRVWVHPGGDDYYHPFASYEEAKRFSEKTEGAEEPLVLVLQREHINESEPGKYEHIKDDRITEWQVEWLAGSKRGSDTIPQFLREKAPDYTYTTNNGAITITKYTGPGGDITIPEMINGLPVTTIWTGRFGSPDPDAFDSCSNLTSVIIPNTVTNNKAMGLDSCANLSTIIVDKSNSVYSSVDGVLFDKDQTTLIHCPRGKTGAYTIPTGVTTIGDDAFRNCPNLTAVTIPNSVTGIGMGNFNRCPGLTTITFPESIAYIGFMAFQSCTNLTEIYFLGNRPRLCKNVFSGASNATFYYTAKAKGWRDTFCGHPTTLWDPQKKDER